MMMVNGLFTPKLAATAGGISFFWRLAHLINIRKNAKKGQKRKLERGMIKRVRNAKRGQKKQPEERKIYHLEDLPLKLLTLYNVCHVVVFFTTRMVYTSLIQKETVDNV